MTDTTSAAPSDAEIDAQWGESVAKHETTAAFVRDFARAVLAKWGAPQPVAREQLTWVSVAERLPEPGTPVLLDIGRRFPIRAMWAAKHTVEAHDEAEPEWCDYDDASDNYYCPEGWYEWNQHEEVHWRVHDTPVAWMPLPAQGSDDAR